MFVFIYMAQETIYCEYCKQRFDIRGYQGHLRSKKHIRALHLYEKKQKRAEELKKEKAPEPEKANVTEENKPVTEANEEPAKESEEPTLAEASEELEDLTESEEEATEEPKEERDYMTIRIIDGKEKKEKDNGIVQMLEKMITPELVGALGQMIIQAVANRSPTTQPVSAPQWGYDDKGNPINF
jgi:hypothetical protein